MTKYLLRRLVGMISVMLIVAIIVFVIARVVPGDPAAVMLGSSATPADVAALRSQMGLDQPLFAQFLLFLGRIVHLDLGESIFLNQPVLKIMVNRSEITFFLTLMAIFISVSIGVPIGILSAVKRGTWIDQTVTAVSMAGASTPSFWIGLMLIGYFSVSLGWFPVAGYGDPGAGLGERLYHLVLPAFALGIPNSAMILRFTRTSMLDVLGEDYIRTARAKGLGGAPVILKHAFRNALIPVLTVIGITTAMLIGGAIVTETVFGLPGLGNLIVSAVLRRDYPVIEGSLLVISGIYVLINLGIDLLYVLADPRVRY